MNNEINELIEYLNRNKDSKLEALSNIDDQLILSLRQRAAEAGMEMTPKEVKEYLYFIRDLLS